MLSEDQYAQMTARFKALETRIDSIEEEVGEAVDVAHKVKDHLGDLKEGLRGIAYS